MGRFAAMRLAPHSLSLATINKMTVNSRSKFIKYAGIGLLLAFGFVLFFFAAYTSTLHDKNSDGQIAVAFISAPISVIIIKLFQDLIGGWACLLIAGIAQYFMLGFFGSMLLDDLVKGS